MFISPRVAIKEGWVTHPKCNTLQDWEDNKFVSPNALDFTLDTLFTINHNNMFVISEQGKQMRGGSKLTPVLDRRTGLYFWNIDGNSVYDGMSDIYIKVPEKVVAHIIIRSTFNRNGINIYAGLYDSMFSGHCGFSIHNRSGKAKIGIHTRIGQLIFETSDNATTYSGSYNHTKNSHWSDEC